LAEALGTFILVYLGVGAVIEDILGKKAGSLPAGSLGIFLAFAGALGISAFVFGKFGHFNPAVTAGLAAARLTPADEVPFHLLAIYALKRLLGTKALSVAHLGAPALTTGTTPWTGAVWEALGAAILTAVVMTIVSRPKDFTGPLIAGFALALAVVMAAPYTGGAINPVRALAPMIIGHATSYWWLYLLAPLAGGIGAALLTQDIVHDINAT